MDMRRLVGKNFTRLRDERNMTQEDVAAATGISQQYLSGLERGKRNPTIITIHEISLALDVDPMEFLRRNKKSKD